MECTVSRQTERDCARLLRWSNAGVPSLMLAVCWSHTLEVRAEELLELPVCSAAAAGIASNVCTITPSKNGSNEVKVTLTAQTARIDVAGYGVVTDNYNGNYLTPVVEARPGDTAAAHIINTLEPRSHGGVGHTDHDSNPTNLHYFHGGIVTPNNARPKPAELGDGDNVYVYLRSDKDPKSKSHTFDQKVPIPGEGKLDAGVLEGTGFIAHPLGLNWYHSHLHGISSHQVMGGMSGLLSTGHATANVRAACRKDSQNVSGCLNDVEKETQQLRSRTKVRYALLRDISLKQISKRPDEPGTGTAQWDPMKRDFPPGSTCGAWDGSKLDNDDAKLRLGFCQRDLDTAWLFTINGQRFPTITVEAGENLLIRMGNVSSNIGYWLEATNETDGAVLPLTVLSLDGVVPARPVSPDQAETPVAAAHLGNVLLMPASRIEFYVRNDQAPHQDERVYVLRTKGLKNIGRDEWPEIQLARIVLKPSARTTDVGMGLQAAVAKPVSVPTKIGRLFARVLDAMLPEEKLPEGCVRDLNPAFKEYRRVMFLDEVPTASNHGAEWSVMTEIIRPSGPDPTHESEHPPAGPDTTINPIPFEEYSLSDGTIDWTTKPHVCIKIDKASQGSHKQLWVLVNGTDTLHNFHIHQMKFRLATSNELKSTYHIDPSLSTCDSQSLFKCFEDSAAPDADAVLWHDTIPMPPLSWVYVVMSYDAAEQLGRFVFHCHILKHEDKGLMAPVEVWGKP